jgi:hypothetical protein
MFILLLCVAAAVAINRCAEVMQHAPAPQPDPGDISIGGSLGSTAMFLSNSFLYSVAVGDMQGMRMPTMDVKQAALGQYAASTGVITRFTFPPAVFTLFAALIPAGSQFLNFLSVDQSGQLVGAFPPVSLSTVLPPGFVATAAGARVDALGNMQGLFFASAETLLCVAGPPTGFTDSGVFNLTRHFQNPLAADVATSVGVDEQSLRVFVTRRSSPAVADVLVLDIVSGCTLRPFTQTFVSPNPIAPRVQTVTQNNFARYFWATQPDGDSGLLFKWDLSASPTIGTLDLGLHANDVIAPIGFAEPHSLNEAYGIIVSQRPVQRTATTVTVVEAVSLLGTNMSVVCNTVAKMKLPVGVSPVKVTLSAPHGQGHSLVLVDESGTFSLLFVPTPTRKRDSDSLTSPRRSRGVCVPQTFGFPATCEGCTPPQAVCGVTQDCAAGSGCCFVVGGRVMCCTQSPLNTTGFGCM